MQMSEAVFDSELGCVSLSVERITYVRTREGLHELISFITVGGCVHPGNSKEITLLPEEIKNNECIVVYTGYTLSTGTQENPETSSYIGADRIHWNGQVWRVVKVRDWSEFGYVQALAIKMEEGE